jgi:hypothetical protein
MIRRAMLAVAYATGRASHARQVKGDDLDKKGYPGPPGWGLGLRLTTPPCKKILLRNLKRRPTPTQGCRADDDDDELYLKFMTCTIYEILQTQYICIVFRALSLTCLMPEDGQYYRKM